MRGPSSRMFHATCTLREAFGGKDTHGKPVTTMVNAHTGVLCRLDLATSSEAGAVPKQGRDQSGTLYYAYRNASGVVIAAQSDWEAIIDGITYRFVSQPIDMGGGENRVWRVEVRRVPEDV